MDAEENKRQWKQCIVRIAGSGYQFEMRECVTQQKEK